MGLLSSFPPFHLQQALSPVPSENNDRPSFGARDLCPRPCPSTLSRVWSCLLCRDPAFDGRTSTATLVTFETVSPCTLSATMSPIPKAHNVLHTLLRREEQEVTKPTDPHGLVLEAWAEGYMIGSLIIMSCITLANMRRGVLLHKLILLELVLGYWQGFFILFDPPVYAWWLSVAAIFLNISWSLHNVIAWMKIRPFLNKTASRLFIGSVILVQPYWVVEIYANFTYFHNVNTVFLKTRPWEALCRDPWWVLAACILFYNIKTKYDLSITQIVQISPRCAVGDFRTQVCATGWYQPVLETVLRLQVSDGFRGPGRFQDGPGPLESFQDEPIGQFCHGRRRCSSEATSGRRETSKQLANATSVGRPPSTSHPSANDACKP